MTPCSISLAAVLKLKVKKHNYFYSVFATLSEHTHQMYRPQPFGPGGKSSNIIVKYYNSMNSKGFILCTEVSPGHLFDIFKQVTNNIYKPPHVFAGNS